MNLEEGGMPRGLSPEALEEIEVNFYRGMASDMEVRRLIETIHMQRRVLETLFGYFTHVPLRIISMADPVRTATLDELRRMVCMERPKGEDPPPHPKHGER
jgi:hypothetical protein